MIGCENTTNVSNNNTYFAFESLNSLLGKEGNEVFNKLKISLNDLEVKPAGEKGSNYIFKNPIKIEGNDCKVTLGFYNDVFVSFSFEFDTDEAGYNYSKMLRSDLGKIYGSPSTYPTLSTRLDNLENIDDIYKASSNEFYEEWKLKLSDEATQKILEGTKYKALNIMLRLQINSNINSIVTIKYSADKNSAK